MTAITNTVSTFIDSQLPEFIKSDNPNFGAFLKAYYQWMEDPVNGVPVISSSKQLMSYKDIDQTSDAFIQYFINDFLPYFPKEVALDERKLIKHAREFYQKKGSVESVKFLFRVLYNKEADIFFPKNNILKASDGKWQLPRALRLVLSIANENFDVSQLVGRQGIGSTSNASCVIESANKVVDGGLGFEIVEIYISNLSKTFSDLENLNVVYGQDANGIPLVFTEKIIASLSNIVVDPNNRGLKYKGYVKDIFGNFTYYGDPVVISGGLSTNDIQARKAVAFVGNVTSGSITGVAVNFGGYGYRVAPNTITTVINAPSDNTGAFANVIVSGIDLTNLTFLLINTDNISYKANALISSANYAFTNIASANANTTLANAFSFANLQFAPIASMNVINGGGGYTDVPTLNTSVVYYSDLTSDSANLTTVQPMSDLGYIAAVNVVSGGSGYSNVTDKIVFPSALGYGATFNFITGANGVITSVIVTNRGEGYINLPTNLLVVNSVNIVNSSAGSGALVTAYGFGQGANLSVAVNQIGQIIDFRIVNRGFDYINTPNVSLRIQDIVIVDPGLNLAFSTDSVIYQGSNANSTTYKALIDSYNVSTQSLRVYNYQGSLNISANLVVTTSPSNVKINTLATNYLTSYGDGKAKANAVFLNGLIQYPGYYLNTDGFLSADMYLQDSKTYHNYSYVIQVEQALNDYKDALMRLVHPPGTSMLGNYVVSTESLQDQDANGEISIIPVVSGSINANAFGNGTITGVGTQFTSNANVGDLISFNTSDSSRALQTKQIVSITNNTIMLLESNTMFLFQNIVSTVANSNVISGFGMLGNVSVNDIVNININGAIVVSNVQVVAANTINVNTVFSTTNSNLTMLVYPTIVNASYSFSSNVSIN